MLPKRLQPIFEQLGLGLFGLVLPLVFYPGAEDAYRLPQLIALSLALLCLMISWSAPVSWSPALIMAVAFFNLRLISHLAAGFRLDWVLEQLEYALLLIWACSHLGDPFRRKRLKAAILTGAALAAIYALCQSYGFDPLAAGRTEQGFGARAHATLGNPDFWGGYLILVIPLAIMQPWLLPLFVVALVLSQTRAAWLGFGAGALLLAWKGPRRRMLLAGGLGLGVLLVYTFPGPLNPRGLQSLQRLASSVDASHSDASGRFFMAHAAWNIALAHPVLGAGGGHFTEAFLAEQGRMLVEPSQMSQPYRFTHDAHDDWLQLAAESGFPALLLFFAMVALALWKAWRSEQWWLAAILASFGVNALLHFPLAIVPSAALFWIFLGCAFSSAVQAAPVGPHEGKAFLKGIGGCLCLLGVLVFTRQLYASALLNRGMSLSLAGALPESEDPLQAAVRINASDSRAWLRLGLNADARGDIHDSEADFMHCQDSPEGLANLGLSQAKQGRLAEGKATSLKALALNPRSVEAMGNLGKIEYLAGDAAASEETYKEGLQVQPDWSQGHFNLAAIYINANRKAEAREQLEDFLRLDPANAQAAELLKGLK